MTIIVFLLDTSASMNQKTYCGTSILDIAKVTVDNFLKLRQKDSASLYDRYMLLSFEDPPNHLKAAWKENQATFAYQLKNIKAYGVTCYSQALANAFHLLNVNRLQSGIDSFGSGRYPFHLEPVMLITITDGCSLTTPAGLQSEVQFSMPTCLGSELYKEPFRWDQRLYTLVLRLPAHYPENAPPLGAYIPSDGSPAASMSEVTGGRSYCIYNLKMLSQCLESLVQKVQHGVVVMLERRIPNDAKTAAPSSNPAAMANHAGEYRAPTGPTTNGYPESPNPNADSVSSLTSAGNSTADWQCVRQMVHVSKMNSSPTQVRHWPLPEAFWPDLQTSSLPVRSANPVLTFTTEDAEPIVIESFPFDKYELEPSPFTQKLLERKQPSICWQVLVTNSGRHGNEAPVGYLKASTTLTTVNLFVMPYDYPRLLPLIKELTQSLNCKPSKEWKASFDKYLKNVPAYYVSSLRKALSRLGVGHLTPEHTEQFLSYSVMSYLKRVKAAAKAEHERLCQWAASQAVAPAELTEAIPRSPLPLATLIDPSSSATARDAMSLRRDANDHVGWLIPFRTLSPGIVDPAGVRPLLNIQTKFSNIFDVNRIELLSQLIKMRSNLADILHQQVSLAKSGGQCDIPDTSIQSVESRHSQLIESMGNYHDYMSFAIPSLRSIESSVPIRQHAFGNPFKLDKRNMHADEIDIDAIAESPKSSPSAKQKRPGSIGTSSSPGSTSSDESSHLLRKRKPGPLPKDFRYKRRKPGDAVYASAISAAFAAPGSPEIEEVTPEPSDDDDILEISEVNNGFPEDEGPVSDEVIVIPFSNHIVDEETLLSDPDATVLTRDEISQLKRQVTNLVRVPGKNYQKLVKFLKEIPQSDEIHEHAAVEAGRFKRFNLQNLLRNLDNRPSSVGALEFPLNDCSDGF